MIRNGEYYLITTDNWFIGNDGMSYRAVWGRCHLKTTEEVFGFTPLRPSTNWYVQVGEDENQVIVAGCQLHYAIRCDKRPKELIGVYHDGSKELANNNIFFTEE